MSFFHHVFSLFYEATSSSDFFIQLIQKLICCVVGVFFPFILHFCNNLIHKRLHNFRCKKFINNKALYKLIIMFLLYVLSLGTPLVALAGIVIFLAKLHVPLDILINNNTMAIIAFLLPIAISSVLLLLCYNKYGLFSHMPELAPLRIFNGIISIFVANIVELFMVTGVCATFSCLIIIFIYLVFAIPFIISTLFTGKEIYYTHACIIDTNNSSLHVDTKNIKYQGKQLEIRQDPKQIIYYNIQNIVNIKYYDIAMTERCIIFDKYLHTLSEAIHGLCDDFIRLSHLLIYLMSKLFKK